MATRTARPRDWSDDLSALLALFDAQELRTENAPLATEHAIAIKR
jgi:hypothetical protein